MPAETHRRSTATRPTKSARWLRALGTRSLPERIVAAGQTYRLLRIFKHDFFAATGLYEGLTGAVVLKVGRETDFLGLPLQWLGRWLIHREAAIYSRLLDVDGVPCFFGTWRQNGFIHAYVPGHPLGRHEWVNDEFFDRLQSLLEELHRRDVAYVDLNKRENIVVGADGRPYLIDFQISLHWPQHRGRKPAPVRWLLALLQHADRYHLAKHVKKHRPDLVRSEHERMWQKGVKLARMHRWISQPFTRLRRRTLKRLQR